MARLSIAAALCAAFVMPAAGSASLRAHAAAGQHEVAAKAVQETLLAELAKVDRDGRLIELTEEMRPMYDALPKNDKGKLEAATVRYALHRFFVQTRGWYVEGLHPSATSWSASAPMSIMKDRVPAFIQGLFEEFLRGQGLGLPELAAFAATIQTLVHKEAMELLLEAYASMNLPTSGDVGLQTMDQAIETYLLSYIIGTNLTSTSQHQLRRLRADIDNIYPAWPDVSMWAKDVRKTMATSRNPFVRESSDFVQATEVVEEIGHRFGVFQDQECHAMKDLLVDMEFQGSGRVLLKDFYRGSLDGNWQFAESVEYLRSQGALDESDPRMPAVVIPNYITSHSNCLASSSFYSVCCMDQCENLLGQLERHFASPTVEPHRVAEFVAGMSSETVDAPRNLSASLLRRLDEIAVHHGGRVPLHGRLFAQWMHHAYPRECPFPHESGTVNPVTPDEWMAAGERATVSKEDIVKYVGLPDAQQNSTVDLNDQLQVLPWTSIEELVSVHQPGIRSEQGSGISTVAYGVLLVAFASVTLPSLKSGLDKLRGGDASKLPRYMV